MTKAIELKATILKIVRTNGKAEAQMIVTVPLSMNEEKMKQYMNSQQFASVEIPLGSVKINIQTLQSAMFADDETKKKR